jgi:hypothetical protein
MIQARKCALTKAYNHERYTKFNTKPSDQK